MTKKDPPIMVKVPADLYEWLLDQAEKVSPRSARLAKAKSLSDDTRHQAPNAAVDALLARLLRPQR